AASVGSPAMSAESSAEPDSPQQSAPSESAAPPPEPPRSPSRRAARWLATGTVLAAGLAWAAGVEGPAWRLDLWNVALLGQPRLLGAWSPAGAFALWLVVVPLALAVWALLAPLGRRRAAAGWLASWAIATATLWGADAFLRSR